MPRARKKPNGAVPSTVPVNAPPQPVRTVPGQDYGVAGAQQAALQAAPLPDLQAAAAAQLDPVTAAQQFAMPNLSLGAPSDRPDEPITAGLPSGPGPGPEVLGQAHRLRASTIFETLASFTNDPELASLAEAVARRNL